MCGLIFLYQQKPLSERILHNARTALDLIQHRGPDEQGVINESNWFAGHRRLSIVDLSSSQQPMQDPSKRYTLLYNGEIYNYKELRKEIGDRWCFSTQGDTEAILAGLVTIGIGFLSKMQGMWAIAFWDNKHKELYLSRDRIGKKPLFFSNKGNCFACASELSALAAISPVSFEEDLDSTADYLRYGYFIPGTTAYKNIREVMPGHFIVWRPGKDISETPYWKLKIGRFQGSKEEAAEVTRSLLITAVKRRMVADVEVGAFLSGGIDSSLIVSIMVNEFGIKPKTFTIGFNDNTYDERRYANIISRSLKTDHHEAVITQWNPENLIELIMNNFGQPFADSSILPTASVSKLAANYVKVVLSGDGADEIFSGYQRYQARILFKWYFLLPNHLRRNIATFINIFPHTTAHHSRSMLKKAHLFIDAAKRYSENPDDVSPRLYTEQAFRKIAPALINRGHTNKLAAELKNEDDVLRMMFDDMTLYLPQDILTKVDRASMAHSIEARCPYLDTDLIEHCFSIPRQWHRNGFSGKKLIKTAFKSWLPDTIWKRRKQGFAVPIAAWFKGKLGGELEQLLTSKVDQPFDSMQIKNMLLEHKNSIADHSMRLWSIYVYLVWKTNWHHKSYKNNN